MVHAAESDIICPSVSTEDPLGLLGKEVFILHDILAYFAVLSFQNSNQLIGSSSVGHTAVEGIQIFLACSLNRIVGSVRKNAFHLLLQAASQRLLSEQHTHTELSVVLEQGVIPCRTSAVLVYGIRGAR